MADLSVMSFLNEETQQETEYNLKDAQARRDIATINGKIGSANGIAGLDANGRVPSSQLPSYVDDVLEYASQSAFPATGETGKIYIALDTNKTYRWSGSAYVEISESLALGETSSTAYAGSKGKANADAITAMKDGSSIDSFGDVETALAGKVDKVQGKGLSTNDYDNTAKGIVDNIQSNVIATTKLIKDTVGWSGKNLYDLVATSKTDQYGGIWTVNDDKTITVSGTPTNYEPFSTRSYKVLPVGSYILSWDNTNVVNASIDTIRLYKDNTQVRKIPIPNALLPVAFNITVEDDYDRINVAFKRYTNNEPMSGTIKPMIRKSTILDDTYEPYRGTTAFPRDEQRELGARNINATDYSKASALTNITATFNNDGTITANGTTTANESLAGGSAANFKAWYTGSVRIASAPENVLMTLYDATAGANVGTAGQTCNMTAGHDYRLSITFLANKTFTNVVVNPLIVLATDLDDTPAPYAMTNRELTDAVIPKIVPSTTDANTLVKEGTYLYTSLITDAPTIHLPSEITNRYARIEVKTINGTSQLTQVLYTHNKTDFWTRALNNGTFANWFKFSGTEVTP